jgi:hypothetical protein
VAVRNTTSFFGGDSNSISFGGVGGTGSGYSSHPAPFVAGGETGYGDGDGGGDGSGSDYDESTLSGAPIRPDGRPTRPKLPPPNPTGGGGSVASSRTEYEPASPALNDAVVAMAATADRIYYIKTNHTAAVAMGDFIIKDEKGAGIFHVPGKPQFKKKKEMTVSFTREMAGV